MAESAADQTIKDRAEEAAHPEATWRERALNAEKIIKTANLEVLTQRAQIATAATGRSGRSTAWTACWPRSAAGGENPVSARWRFNVSLRRR
ncbi:hypothetical protein [Streptomyces canus]|uniref:hypothetical protein n=1 Tax=Streptomyces canus TaxID=58343 RepID=UPI00371F228A